MSVIECPNCKTTYKFRPEFAGKSARCEKCSHEFSFASQSATVPAATNTAPAESEPLQDVQIDSSFPINHVPSQFGEVVRQWPYHQPLRSTLGISAACLFVSILFAIGIFDGTFTDWYLSGIPLLYVMYVFTPILAFAGIMFANIAWTSYRKPRVIAVTKIGVYMPMAQLSWRMMFIPFNSAVRWRRTKIEFENAVSQEAFEAKSVKEEWSVSSATFPSKEEFEAFVTMVKQGVKGELA